MKKLLLPFYAILLFTSCKKENTRDLFSNEISSKSAQAQKDKIEVCHYDPVTGVSKTLLLNENALKSHFAHGDLLGDCSVVLTTICDKDWMVKNLDVSTYRNGDLIPQVTDPAQWGALTTGAWCYYANSTATGTIYGKLYNWFAVNDSRGLAPEGWHVPSLAEWTGLESCLNAIPPTGNVGGKLKSTGTFQNGTGLWFSPNTDATNISGFSGLPGGYCSPGSGFYDLRIGGYFWSSTPTSTLTPGVTIFANAGIIYYSTGNIFLSSPNKRFGYSVRLIRD